MAHVARVATAGCKGREGTSLEPLKLIGHFVRAKTFEEQKTMQRAIYHVMSSGVFLALSWAQMSFPRDASTLDGVTAPGRN